MSNDNDNAVRKTIGLDLGDKFSRFCVLDVSGKVTQEGRVSTTQTGLRRRFQGRKPGRVAIETGCACRKRCARAHRDITNERSRTVPAPQERTRDVRAQLPHPDPPPRHARSTDQAARK